MAGTDEELSWEVERTVEVLRAGGIVACPTETLVGLLADAKNARAVDRLVALKGRAGDSPIAVLVPDVLSVAEVATHFPDQVRDLASSSWPGPLTLLLPARDGLPAALVKDGKIGVRVPGTSPALTLVRAFGGPLTATSANRSGEPAARTSEEARHIFGDELDAVVPGEAPGGAPSTVVDATVEPMRVIREGAVVLPPPTQTGDG